jgi:hypothetical protein
MRLLWLEKGRGVWNKIAKMRPSKRPLHNKGPERHCALVSVITITTITYSYLKIPYNSKYYETE